MQTDNTPPPPKRKRSSLRAVMVLLLVFLMGVTTGVGGTALVMVRRLQDSIRHPELAAGPADRVIHRFASDLQNHLDLTPEQDAAVREELDKGRERFRLVRVRMIGEAREAITDTIRRVENRLPDNKREAFRQRVGQRLEPWGLAPAP